MTQPTSGGRYVRDKKTGVLQPATAAKPAENEAGAETDQPQRKGDK